MTFIGEEHYCAQIVKETDFQNVIVCKEIDGEKGTIIGLIVRITAQLAELSLSFKKFKNTRVVYVGDKSITFSFYFHDNKFYIIQTMEPLFLEAMQIGKIIRTIVEDIRIPLFKNIPKEVTMEEMFTRFE